jgi:hypothetical protein
MEKITEATAKILKSYYPTLPSGHEGYWEIIDQYPSKKELEAKAKAEEAKVQLPDLALVHYREDKASGRPLFNIYDQNLRELLLLRGTVVDLKNKRVYVPSHGYDRVLPTDDHLVLEGGDLVIRTPEAKNFAGPEEISLAFDANKIRLRPLLEGVVLRAFKWEGKIFISSYKKLDASLSRWEGGEAFLSMFIRLLGGEDEYKTLLSELFDKVETSPIYVFLVSASGLKMVSTYSKERIFLITVYPAPGGVGKAGDAEGERRLQEGKGYESEKEEEAGKKEEKEKEEKIVLPSKIPFQGVFEDLDMANAVLFPGETPDSRWFLEGPLEQGELKYNFNEAGKITTIEHGWATPLWGEALLLEIKGEGVWKITPPGFRMREDFVGKSPNLYAHYVHQLRPLYRKEIPFRHYPRIEMIEGRKPDLSNFNDRLLLYAEYMYYSANPIHRDEVKTFHSRLDVDLDLVIRFIQGRKFERPLVAESGRPLIPDNIKKRFVDIAGRTEGKNSYEAIEGFLYNEMAATMYGMIKAVHTYLRFANDGEFIRYAKKRSKGAIAEPYWRDFFAKAEKEAGKSASKGKGE